MAGSPRREKKKPPSPPTPTRISGANNGETPAAAVTSPPTDGAGDRRPPAARRPVLPPVPPNEILFEKARRAERAGDDATAERLFERMALDFPDDPRGWAYLGSLKRRRGDAKGALLEYTRALKRFPHDPLLLGFKAEVHLGDEPEPDFAAALACYRKIIAHHGRRRDDLSRRYVDRAKAQIRFCEARKLSIKSRRFLAGDETRKLRTARDLLAQALRIYPEDPRNHMNLGVVLLRLGSYDGAAKHCLDAIRMSPRYARAYLVLGQAYARLGRLKHARDAFLRCIELDRQQRDAQEAWAHRRSVEQEIARERLRLYRALAQVPTPDGHTVRLSVPEVKRLVGALEGDEVEGVDLAMGSRDGYVVTAHSARNRYRIFPGPEGLVIERDLVGG